MRSLILTDIANGSQLAEVHFLPTQSEKPNGIIHFEVVLLRREYRTRDLYKWVLFCFAQCQAEPNTVKIDKQSSHTLTYRLTNMSC